MLATVDVQALLKVVIASIVAGALITTAFSCGLYGLTRYDEKRRAGPLSAGLPFAALSVLGFAVFVAALAAGLIVMTQK